MKRLFIISAILLFASASGYSLEVPALKGRVNDYGSMISSETISRLENELKNFEESDSTQVVILTVESLDGDSMEDFTIRVAEKWKIGQKKKDNGVILFASKNDRRMRIEVGRGLEGVLTDLLAGRILDNMISPKFKAGNFDEGFSAGIEAIIQVCRGEFTNESGSDFDEFNSDSFSVFFLILIVFIFNILKSLKNAIGCIVPTFILIIIFIVFLGFLYAGLISPFFIGIFLIIFFAVTMSIVFGKGGSGGGGFDSGWSSSDSGGFSGSSDSFSGGGGSFGGGGSSGGW
jgi:uncharacterized protein